MKKFLPYMMLAAMSVVCLCACSDDENFSTSQSDRLTFSLDSIALDTVFSSTPSSTRSMWIYNKSKANLRCTTVRLENGNQSGFRVNVDGVFLSPTLGYQTNDIEVRKGDSVRVFVEITPPRNTGDQPKLVSDNIVFALESGVQQKVNLNAYSWNAAVINNMTVDKDTVLSGDKPIVVYGKIKVQENATLAIAPGTTLYFHSGAGIDVEGRLLCSGTPSANVTLRGDRLDKMFDYLPYDYVSGQWQGIHLLEKSYDNVIEYTDIHSTFDGLIADSSDVSRTKLTLSNSTIHNCQGDALHSVNSKIDVSNCQLTNALGHCLDIEGGVASVNNCTLAQFYPYDSKRGSALSFSGAPHALASFDCRNTLITGYADDEMMGTKPAEGVTDAFEYSFSNCIIRTPKVEGEDSVHFVNVEYEDVADTARTGEKNFVKVDADMLRYDFRLSNVSPAIDKADPATATTADRNGAARDGKPDVGAFEFVKEEEKTE